MTTRYEYPKVVRFDHDADEYQVVEISPVKVNGLTVGRVVERLDATTRVEAEMEAAVLGHKLTIL